MNNTNRNILVIDDNLTVCLMLKSWLAKKGYNVETATHVAEAKQLVKDHLFDLILSDIRMPEVDGFSFLAWVKKYDSDIIVIMMTGFADIESAVEAMKSGAADYISKPIEPEQLFKKIDEAFLLHENIQKQNRIFDDFVKFPGDEYHQLYHQLDLTAENNKHQLIIGDRGTGKMSVVKYIYEKGMHMSKPFVIFDFDKSVETPNSFLVLSEKTEELSVLMQKFNEAQGGLLYIRQLTYLTINLQDELINILTRQKKGPDFTQVIMSTDVGKEELQKRLVPKLYNLIESDCIILPTLKGKKDAIIFMANYFLRFANVTLDKQIESIDPAIMQKLVLYPWQGNIQELKNCIIKAALLTEGTVIPSSIGSQLFGFETKKNENNVLQMKPLQGLRKENYEKEKIVEALELAKGNKTMAASILNIDRKTLYNKIKLYNVLIHN